MSVSLERAINAKAAAGKKKNPGKSPKGPRTPWQAPDKRTRQEKFSKQKLKDIAMSEVDDFPPSLADLSVRWPLIDPRRWIEHLQSGDLRKHHSRALARKCTTRVRSRLDHLRGWLEAVDLKPRVRIPIPSVFSTREKDQG